jgi:hypothetical protein
MIIIYKDIKMITFTRFVNLKINIMKYFIDLYLLKKKKLVFTCIFKNILKYILNFKHFNTIVVKSKNKLIYIIYISKHSFYDLIFIYVATRLQRSQVA